MSISTQQILTDVGVLFAGIFIALVAVYYILKVDIQKLINLKTIEINKEAKAHLLPLRLQAHERLIIFIDRINPANLLVRLHQQSIGVAVLQAGLLNEIKSEYQHNIAQQLYVSNITWRVIRKLKDDTIVMINNTVQGLPANVSGIELSKAILKHMATIDKDPYDLTLELIKQDIQQLF